MMTSVKMLTSSPPLQAHTEPLRRAAAEECADLFMDVGDAYAAVGRPQNALHFYGVLTWFPAYDQPALWLKMGQCAALVGDYEGAVEKLRKGGFGSGLRAGLVEVQFWVCLCHWFAACLCICFWCQRFGGVEER